MSVLNQHTITADPSRHAPLIDPSGRTITYLRLSVTDRCDFRCHYCMAEKVKFLPKKDVLSLEELYLTAKTFINCGIHKIRLTGGEPLVRRDIRLLIDRLGDHLKTGELTELTLTTNGSQLVHYADSLSKAGVKRINVSLDCLDPDKFKAITRRGDLTQVLQGIEAAKQAGIQIKINMVVLGQENLTDILEVTDYCLQNGFDLTLIEAMPMDAGADANRQENYVPLAHCVDLIGKHHKLEATNHQTSGPARYMGFKGYRSKLGLITPMSQNFCAGCNRIRLTCTGKLYPCLGHDTHLDFREKIRNGATEADLINSLRDIISRKPQAHDFSISDTGITSATLRSMNTTGG